MIYDGDIYFNFRRITNRSTVASPWGANEAELDQMTDRHKKELALMHETHVVKKDIFDKNHATRRRNFENTVLAEERKVRMQCRKQAIMRSRKVYIIPYIWSI